MAVNRFGNGRVLFAGVLLAAVAYALFLPVAPDWAYATMLPTMLLLGLAFSLAYGPLTMAATDGVDEPEHGLASGLLYTSMQFGTALGISAVTVASVATVSDAATGIDLAAVRGALVVSVAAALLAAAITAFGLARRRPPVAAGDVAPEPVQIAA